MASRGLGLLLTAALTFSVSADEGTIFKHRDASGAISYSDSASGPRGGRTEPLPPAPITSIASPPEREAAATEKNRDDSGLYRQLVIISPNNDQQIRSNNGELTVTVKVVPPLRRGDTIVITLDGGARAQITAPNDSATLTNVDRGQHKVQAVLMDGSQSIILRSSSKTLFVHRFSALSRP